MFQHSVVVRLMTPIIIMLALVGGVSWLASNAHRATVDALSAVSKQEQRALALSELRSVSRSLQRDILNLIAETDPRTVAELHTRFDRRMKEFSTTLATFERQERSAEPEYFTTQHVVINALAHVRAKTAQDRGEAWQLFRTEVRPAERHASQIADKLIDQTSAETRALTANADAIQKREAARQLLLSLALIAVSVGAGLYVSIFTVARPIGDIRFAMDQLAAGDDLEHIPHTKLGDAIGAMARSLQVLRNASRERDRLQREAIERDRADALEGERVAAEQSRSNALERQRRELALSLAEAVDASLRTVNDKLRLSAERLLRSAEGVQRHASTARSEADITTSAATDATGELVAVGTASTQLAVSVSDLREKARGAAFSVGQAADRSRLAREQVSTLTQTADQVGNLAEMIRNFANTCHLLALNASIEAARVGDVGKGFVVVATEIKRLAGDVAAATEHVEAQLAVIRRTATDACSALSDVDGAVEQIEREAMTIAAAMTQQEEASRDIDQGMRSALAGVDIVTRRMTELRSAAHETDMVASELQTDATGLAADASRVDTALRKLITDLKHLG